MHLKVSSTLRKNVYIVLFIDEAFLQYTYTFTNKSST